MSTITVVLLNWQRRRNVTEILKVLKKQTIKPKIFIWNNNPKHRFKESDADWIVNSSKNVYCFPRWLLASLADTEYIMTLDDDLIPIRDDFIEKAIDVAKLRPEGITGIYGKQTPDKPPYYKDIGDGSNIADIIKGRCMVMRTELLKKVPLFTGGKVTREDDIYISYHVADGIKTPHFISVPLRQMTHDLNEFGVGLGKDPRHMGIREKFLANLIKKRH